MTKPHELTLSDHGSSVAQYYSDATPGIYIGGWNPDHIHFGLFEPGECPEVGESLAESPGIARAVERMIDVIVSPAEIQASHRVVDAGCGIGGTAIRLAQAHGCAITGINISRPQLEIAGRKVRESGLDDRIELAYADCSQHLPFADDSVDVVVNIESACHYSDRGQFLREVRRILKPGGRIVAMDWLVCDGLQPGQHKRYIEPLYKAWTIRSLESRSTYTEQLQNAGVNVIEVEGFDGRDADNLRFLEYGYQLLLTLWFGGMETDAHRTLMEQFRTLSMAWRNECFELGRYVAEKPASA